MSVQEFRNAEVLSISTGATCPVTNLAFRSGASGCAAPHFHTTTIDYASFSPLRDPHLGTLKIKRHSVVSERRASTSDGMLAGMLAFRVCNVFSAHFANARNEIEPNKTFALALAQTPTATHCVLKSSCERANGGE